MAFKLEKTLFECVIHRVLVYENYTLLTIV